MKFYSEIILFKICYLFVIVKRCFDKNSKISSVHFVNSNRLHFLALKYKERVGIYIGANEILTNRVWGIISIHLCHLQIIFSNVNKVISKCVTMQSERRRVDMNGLCEDGKVSMLLSFNAGLDTSTRQNWALWLYSAVNRDNECKCSSARVIAR